MLQVSLNLEKLEQFEYHAVHLAWSKWFLRGKIHSAFCGIYMREVLFREKGEMKVSNKINGISWRHSKREKSWNGGKIGVTGSRRPLQSIELFVRGICMGFNLKNSVNDQNIFSHHPHLVPFPQRKPHQTKEKLIMKTVHFCWNNSKLEMSKNDFQVQLLHVKNSNS